MLKSFVLAALCWGVACADVAAGSASERARAACDSSRYRPDRFHVAIDRASGIAFIESPCGWTYIGVVARASIESDIRMSGAKAVPAHVLRAELARRPDLAEYLPPPSPRPAPRAARSRELADAGRR